MSSIRLGRSASPLHEQEAAQSGDRIIRHDSPTATSSLTLALSGTMTLQPDGRALRDTPTPSPSETRDQAIRLKRYSLSLPDIDLVGRIKLSLMATTAVEEMAGEFGFRDGGRRSGGIGSGAAALAARKRQAEPPKARRTFFLWIQPDGIDDTTYGVQ